jgi:hypothetical protein
MHISTTGASKCEIRRAGELLHSAIKSGKITKPSACDACGIKAEHVVDIHAHHSDYSKPYEVLWLCSACHKRLHKDIRDLMRIERDAGLF